MSGAAVEVFAPGKLFVFGEWSVLRGGPALLTSVPAGQLGKLEVDIDGAEFVVSSPHFQDADRRWTWDEGWRGPGHEGFDPVGAVVERCHHSGPPLRGARLDVSPVGMVHGDKKLGFGSSASVAALTAWAIEQCWVADGFRLGSKEVLALAMEGHRHAQGHRGSGADVAVAALALRMGAADHKPLYLYYCMGDGEAGSPTTTVLRPPSGLSLLAVWTGVCADTRAIMREVDEAARACPGDFGVLMSQMDRLTRDALRAWRAGKIAKLLGFVEPFTWALAELGGLSFVELVTPEHTAISKIVESEAGDAAAAKPSGAGGGDMTIVLCRDAVAGRVSRALTDRGYHVIDLGPTSSASGS